jgi:hypothetical protein
VTPAMTGTVATAATAAMVGTTVVCGRCPVRSSPVIHHAPSSWMTVIFDCFRLHSSPLHISFFTSFPSPRFDLDGQALQSSSLRLPWSFNGLTT